LGDDFSICIIYLGFDQTTKGIWSITMPDMINPQKGIDLTNNNSIINRILFAVTIFQQVWGNGLGQSFFLRITLSSGQEEWSASSGSHSFKVHSCEQFQRMVRFGGWCRTVISLGNGPDSHSLGQTHSLQVALCLVSEEWSRFNTRGQAFPRADSFSPGCTLFSAGGMA
jgi:hypothetical protein